MRKSSPWRGLFPSPARKGGYSTSLAYAADCESRAKTAPDNGSVSVRKQGEKNLVSGVIVFLLMLKQANKTFLNHAKKEPLGPAPGKVKQGA